MENQQNQNRKLYNTIRDDISGGGFRSNISSDFEDLKEYYLNDERKAQLAGMGKVKRFFIMTWWLLSELLLKLTPTRRLVLILGIILLILPGKFGLSGGDVSLSTNTSIFGGILILFVLMLELKDKLVAKDELNAGRTVQKALMSESNPEVNGWKIWLYTQPANDVGGDLVDIIKHDEGRFGVTIADVSGKGLGAALLMAKLQTIIRALSPEHKSLPEFFYKLNHAFHKDILPNSFASMVYIQLNENKDDLEIINAGHLPPVVIKEGKLVKLEKGNVALGLIGDTKFKSEIIDLKKDDYFIAFSDGVTEARNVTGNFLGTERLFSSLEKLTYTTPEELGKKILQQVKHFIGDAKTHDDLSIIILKRN
ncbi:MAG: PP2C family protein-serine/threonine phosphatase [Ignavibacteriales bacterium]|nr:PP2C family protein-serine/threonine phosphatase [Ignavibacteriales bacterium]